MIIPHQVRQIKFEFVSFRFVNPTSFVYGPKEENEPETCMSEKMNFTFHVREVDCWDICNKLRACSCCILQRTSYAVMSLSPGPPWLTAARLLVDFPPGFLLPPATLPTLISILLLKPTIPYNTVGRSKHRNGGNC